MISIKQIFCYPFKSAQGIALSSSRVEERGLAFDRRWMAVDIGGTFLSQRTHPALARIGVRIEDETLRLSAPGMHQDLHLPLHFHSAYRRNVIVWDDCMSALHISREADEWISEYLKETCGIVYFPDDSRRLVDTRYARHGEHTAFSDGYPVLLVSQASLDELNTRLDAPLPVDRFRPNLVLGGCAPYEEDTWTSVAINDVLLEVVKPCARCAIPTIDQKTLAIGVEPLRALSGYRKKDNKILFAQNALVGRTGTIAIGDRLEPLVRT
jgi:uncharacterized protein